MSIPNIPKTLPSPIAVDGNKNSIPVETPTGTGKCSFKEGYPPLTSLPLKVGGVPPTREDFNGVAYLLSSHLHYIQSGNMYNWSDTLDYKKGCIVKGSNEALYIALKDNGLNYNTPQNPINASDYWKQIINENGNVSISSLTGVLPIEKGGTGNKDGSVVKADTARYATNSKYAQYSSSAGASNSISTSNVIVWFNDEHKGFTLPNGGSWAFLWLDSTGWDYCTFLPMIMPGGTYVQYNPKLRHRRIFGFRVS